MGIKFKNLFKGNVLTRLNLLRIYFTHFVNLETRFRVTHKLKMLSNLENQILKK